MAKRSIKKLNQLYRQPDPRRSITNYNNQKVVSLISLRCPLAQTYNHQKSSTSPKKRTNTLVQLKKHIPSKRSISTQRHRNATSAKKREEINSDESDKQDQPFVNMSHRKLKPSHSKGGLGKRSKSTIIKTGPLQIPRQTQKKQTKKTNSNPTVESIKPKTKRKKSSKIIQQPSKEIKQMTKISTSRRQFIPIASKQVPKRQKLNLKLDKTEGKGEKKSARNHITAKSNNNSQGKISKPVSAREKKNSKRNRFIEQLKEKYQNQTILEGDISSRLRNSDDIDHEFLSVMGSLEKVLNSVSSKQKLKKEIELISEKLKQFNLQSQSDKSQIYEEDRENQLQEQYQPQPKIDHSKTINEANKKFNKNDADMKQKQSQDSEDQYPLRHKIQEENGDYQEDISPKLDEKKNPLISKKNHNFFFAQQPNPSNEDANDRKKEIQMLKKFKNESTKMMQKVGLNTELNNAISHAKVQLKILQKDEQPVISNLSNLSNGSNNSGVHNWQDKYPLVAPKSPKFDDGQLMGMISLKEQFLSNKHDKMSELVKKMFEKQLVSPKSYEFQIKSLKRKYDEENQALQSIKKQAEQMSSMLSEIKKDKEEIQGIDELIRNEKWEEAQKLVQKNKIQIIGEQSQQQHRQQSPEPKAKKQVEQVWQKQQGWERVRIKPSDYENNQFVDIGQITNRGRRKAIERIDIDQQCGGTEESVEYDDGLKHSESEEQYIYYNQQNENDDDKNEGGLIRLVQISEEPQEQAEDKIASIKINENVFHIESQDSKSKDLSASNIEKNQSACSSQSDRKGFITNLYFIKEYCIALCEFVRDNEIFKTQFKNNVSKPLEFNLSQMLKYLREEDTSKFVYSKRSNKMPISELVWNEFNAQYESLKCNINNGKTGERYKMERQHQIIFVRMIYDVLNESLDSQRPGGQFGKAFPWKQGAKHLKNLNQLNKPQKDNVQAYDLMFGVAIARIIQWGSCLCGFLPDTVQLENTEIDQPYVNHIRQTRMAFLLEKMMAQQQSIMTNFEMQQSEIEFKVAELVMAQLFEQANTDLRFVFEERLV